MSTKSSALPKPVPPLDAVTPITVKRCPPILIDCPTADAPVPNRSSRVVGR